MADRIAAAREAFSRIKRPITGQNSFRSNSMSGRRDSVQSRDSSPTRTRRSSAKDVDMAEAQEMDIQKQMEQDTTQTHVFYSNIRLMPDLECLKLHRKGKGKTAKDKAGHCDKYQECDEGAVYPATARVNYLGFRLRTGDGAHDLKRFITTPNSDLSGNQFKDESISQFCRDRPYRLTSTAFRSALKFGASQIRLQHTYLRGLEEYVARAPYSKRFNLLINARSLGGLPEDELIDRFTREDLASTLMHMREEIGKLKKAGELCEKRILEFKWEMARKGDEREIVHLLELGVVSLGQVKEFCIL